MKSFTQSLFALAAVALLSSCSRPYATFQKSTPEHFYTQASAAPAVVDQTPLTVQTKESLTAALKAPATPVSADAELQKVDALVSAKAGLSTSKKMTRHLNHVKEMVTEMRAKIAAPSSTVSTPAASVAPHKMTLVQRLVTKSIDQKIHSKMGPKKTMSRSLLSVGIIVALIGLLLLLIGTGTVYSLGYVGLIVGIILIIASLI